MIFRRPGVLSAAAFVLSLAGRAEAGSCEELVRSARTHEAQGDSDVALRQYSDAVSLDATCGDAWLGLGALRTKTGDAAEAERVYTTALTHVPGLANAALARARLRWQLGRVGEAQEDMLRYVDSADVGAALAGLVELAAWYSSAHRSPAELSVWRRVASLAHGKDDSLETRARTTIEALVLVVGPADPVTHPPRVDLLRSVAARLRR